MKQNKLEKKKKILVHLIKSGILGSTLPDVLRPSVKLGPLENPFKDNIRDNVGAGAKAGYGFDEKYDNEEDDRKR